MANHLELQVSCLAGGSILEVHSLQEAKEAEAWGAVAIYLPRLDSLSESDLETLIEEVSLHPLCEMLDFPRLSAAYRQRTLNHFARLTAGGWGTERRAFAYATSHEDVAPLLEARPTLLICASPDLLPIALAERKRVSSPTLIFVECHDIKAAEDAFHHGAHGVFLRRPSSESMPSEAEQRSLMQAVIETSVGEWPSDKQVIGVMAHQGDYLAHVAAMETAIADRGLGDSVAVKEVRTRSQYDRCGAMVLPGGWSNLQTLFLEETQIDRALRAAKDSGLPILGTCAGMILSGSRCGKHTSGRAMLGLAPGAVDNNVVDGITSIQWFETGQQEDILFSNGPVLRDPSRHVQVLAKTSADGQIVAARHESVFVYSFHAYEQTHPAFLDFCMAHWKEQQQEPPDADRRPISV